MQLTPDAAREVICRVAPHVGQLEILSRPRLGATPWQPHATAKIIRDPSVGALPEVDDHAPLSPTHSVTGAEIYAMAERAGLKYGPTFQKLETAAAVRPDRILLELSDEPANPAFGIDPARMDACFHALVLIFSSLRDAVHGTAYVPVRFGEIMLRRPGVTFTKARIDVLRRDERIIIGNFILMDAAGDIVVFMREARFQAIRTSRGAGRGPPDHLPDLAAGQRADRLAWRQDAVARGVPARHRRDRVREHEPGFRAARRLGDLARARDGAGAGDGEFHRRRGAGRQRPSAGEGKALAGGCPRLAGPLGALPQRPARAATSIPRSSCRRPTRSCARSRSSTRACRPSFSSPPARSRRSTGSSPARATR